MTHWHKPSDLKRLAKALVALAETNEDIMFLPELDGFCTGLILCPELIPPSVWLKEVWGDDGVPEFESLEALQKVLGLIMGHYNRVAEMLTRPDEYWPVMNEHQATGTVLFADWVEGFVRAVRLGPSGWNQLLESGDRKALSAFWLLLEIPLLGTGEAELDEDQEANLLKEAPDLIPELVLELNRFTKSLPMASAAAPFPFLANMHGQPAKAGRPGPNGPCHCGSGRKYKKCCGAH